MSLLNLSTGHNSFAFRGAKEYNLLPENIRNLNSISRFKLKVAAHFLGNSSKIESIFYDCRYKLM